MRTVHEPSPPTGLRRLLFRIPIHAYRVGLGGLMGHRFLLLHHTGRVSGAARQVVLEVVDRDAEAGWYVVPSGFGTRSDWYRNVRAHPDVRIRVGRRESAAVAEPLPPEEGADLMARYAERHPRAVKGMAKFMGYEVDGTPEDYRELGRTVPFIKLVPAAGRPAPPDA